jgi:uncharacterized membrane protein
VSTLIARRAHVNGRFMCSRSRPDRWAPPDIDLNGDMNRPSPTLASAFFTGAGVMHFARPDFFESIVPDWFPNKRLANVASGAAEIVLGLGLLPTRTRRASALGLIVLLAAVFPANVDMAINDVEVKPVEGRMSRSVGTAEGAGRIANWVRLPFQLPVAYALWRIARQATPAADAKLTP